MISNITKENYVRGRILNLIKENDVRGRMLNLIKGEYKYNRLDKENYTTSGLQSISRSALRSCGKNRHRK